MGENLTRKIPRDHLAKPSEMKPGDEIYLKVDQTITHDINAVMTYLAFEAINPMYLGVKCVVAKSIARIHKGNLINHGIIPMLFENNEDYDRIELGDELEIKDLPEQIPARKITISDNTKGFTFEARLECTDNELEVVLAGGQLRFLKKQLKEMGVETE